jgi:hypothetical protein
VGTPEAVVVGDALRIYFTGRGAELGDALTADGPEPAPRNDSIGMVASRDLVHFDRFPTGPVFARLANLRVYLGEREPHVARGGDGATLSFVGADAPGDHPLGLWIARSR